MSSKNKKQAAASGKKKGDEQRENSILQAVVLTDSYQTRFRPLTLEEPRCLLPLANVPLIEYTLEWLAFAGVKDVFIFASTHSDKIEEYIRSSKWNKPSSPFDKCQIVMSPSSFSVGDAMRELDGKGMITTDFLLINGDFVSTLPLEDVLRVHRNRRAKDKNAIMTMILRKASSSYSKKPWGERGLFVLDESTDRCIHYEEMRPSKKKAPIPVKLRKEHPTMRIRADLIDCQVDICSPDVPALFTENFDYQHIRRDFLHGILVDFDLYGKTIHTHIVTDGYAARVRSLQTYDSVSKDIIGRRTFPFVPDSNLGTDQNYTVNGHNIYQEEDVILARDSKVGRNTILGRGVNIGEGSSVGNSIIGNGCKIGKNVELDGAYIWENVVIGDGCKIQKSIVASNSVLGNNCLINGAVVSYGVKVEDGTKFEPGQMITSYTLKQASSEVSVADDERAAVPGIDYEDSEDDYTEDEKININRDGLAYSREDEEAYLSSSSIDLIDNLPGEDSDSDSDDEGHIKRTAKTGRSDSTTSFEDADEAWHREAYTSLLGAMENDHPAEVANLELNGLRMTANANFHQVRRAVSAALVARIDQVATKTGVAIGKVVTQTLERWETTIRRCVFERKDEVDFLLLSQRECLHKPAGPNILSAMAQVLNNTMELISEEAINDWWVDVRSSEDEKMAAVRKPTEAFIQWLADAESESESEGDDEDEEESDDE
ncbi:nucleotide-diphospho-sugar transferase [Pyronema domesticum]|nr:nucleotide-diphospho-sugar transferase [Pyronema domesticum]